MRARGDGRSPRVRHGASLSALYLARPQRLVGCSLPPQAQKTTASDGAATKGFVTLTVPHILESAASAQTLPATSLVRFRWRHEENQRGSLFHPAKIANGGHGVHSVNTDDDGIEDDASDTEIKRDGRRGSTPRSIEMVYPISTVAERFVGYLREMRELVFDVIDRDTRRMYGKCTVPLFATSSTSGSNMRGSQQTTQTERLLEQVKRENALYEIKSVHPADQDDTIGYLAVNLDVQFKPNSFLAHAHDEVEEKANRILYQRPQDSESPYNVLIPRSRQTVHVNVQRHADSRDLEHDEHVLSFDRASAISYLESDALHSLPDSNLRGDGSFSPLGTWSAPNERRRRPRDGSPRHVMLRDLIEKGKALQQSMAKAAHDDDSFEQPPDTSVAVSKVPDNGSHHYLDLTAYQQVAESGDENDWDVAPRTMQQLEVRSPQNGAESMRSRQLPSAARLEITFESLEFEIDFVNQLQQLRNSTISSRFSPIELAVSCNDALSKLTSNENDSPDASGTSGPLFSIAMSLRKRVVRLNYSHIVPIRHPVGDIQTKKQLEFFIQCQTQGTPRRTPRRSHLGSRNGQKDFVLLRGSVPVRNVFHHVNAGQDCWLESVQLHIWDESIARNRNAKPIAPTARRKKVSQRVGEMKISFQVSSPQDSESSEPEMKGTSGMVFDSVSSSFEDPSLLAARQEFAEKELEAENMSRGPGIKHRKMERSYPKTVAQLAVMIENATLVRLPESRTGRGTSDPLDIAVRVEYALPLICYVENLLVRVNSVKRTIRRRLTQTRLQSSPASTYRVNFSHVGVFPLELHRKRVQSFRKQLLIMEVWIQESNVGNTDDQLIGLVKVPLDAFSSSLINVFDNWENAEPKVGVDERLPIVDPFSGRTSGYLHARVAIGTAEQIITLTSTARGITKFQAIVRGVFSRSISPFRREKSHHVRKESSQVSAPDMLPEHWSKVQIHQQTASEVPTSNDSVKEHEAWSDAAGPKDMTESVTFLHEIRIEIRDCWVAPRASDVKKQLKSGKAVSALGCEIQGQLHILKDASFRLREPKTVHFALWWDASNRQLNSHFVHSIQSTEPGERVAIDKAEFTFLVENDFVCSAFAKSVTGKATLDLRHFFTSEDNDKAIPEKPLNIYHDVDVPINWQRQGNAHDYLCSSFPLRISYQVSANPSVCAPKFHVNDLLNTARALMGDTQNYPSSMVTTAVSTTRRLLPATIVVSTAIVSIADLKHAIEERWSQVCAIPSERHLKKHLETVLEHKSASLIFECIACVGVEVDEADENGDGIHRFKKDGRWYKKLRLPAAQISVSNSLQALSSLVHQLRISVIVHPEALQSLQDECFVVKILSWSEEQSVEYEIGLVSIPVAAVLFRPSGVQGAFPIQIGEALNGRLGVHVYIDHNHVDRTNVNGGGVLKHDADMPDPELPDFCPVSPTSPEEAEIHFSPNTSEPKHSVQVSIEDFRNVQYIGSIDSSERLRDRFMVLTLEHQDGTAIDAGDIDSATAIRAERQRHRLNDPNIKSIFTTSRWGNVILQASLWHEFKGTGHHFADGYAVKDDASTLLSDQSRILIGRAYVDLSLLDAGWKEVRGWYHILDGQQISRGQVKIRAVVCSKEPSGDGIDDATSGKNVDAIESLGSDVYDEHEELDEHQRQSASLGSLDFLFEESFAESRAFQSTVPHSNAISFIRQGSREIKQSIDCSPSQKVDNSSDHDCASGVTVEIESLGRHDETMSINPSGTPTGVKTISQNAELFVAQSPCPATKGNSQGGEMGAMSEEQSPTADATSAFYQSITLSSFGIDELQFSPISGEDSPAPPYAVDEEVGNPVVPNENDKPSGFSPKPETSTDALEVAKTFSADLSHSPLHTLESPRSGPEVSPPLLISHFSDGESESFLTGRHDAQSAVEIGVSTSSKELHDDQSHGEDQVDLNASYFSLDGNNSPRDEICAPRAEVDECTECVSGEVYPAEDQSRVHVSTIDSSTPGHPVAPSHEEVDKSASGVHSEKISSEVNGVDQPLAARSDINVECSDDLDSEEHRDSLSQESAKHSGDGESDTNSELLEETDSMVMTPLQECERYEKSTQTDAETITSETNLDGEALFDAKIDISELVTPEPHHSDSVNATNDLGKPTPVKSGAAQGQQMDEILSRKATVDVSCGTSGDLVSYNEGIGSTDQQQVGVEDAPRSIAVDEEVVVVGVAYVTSDDSDSYDDDIDHKKAVTEETSSTLVASDEDTATKPHQGSSDNPPALSVKHDAASLNEEDLSPVIKPHGAGAALITGGATHQEEPSKQALLSLSADKFDLICQLLSDIRDSCGSKVVRDLLEAPIPERRLHSDLLHDIEPQFAVHDYENVAIAPRSQPVSPRMQPLSPRRVPTPLSVDYDEQVESALHVSAATKSLHQPHPRKYNVSDNFTRSVWSDSYTLRQEIKRRMERDVAGSEVFQSSRAQSANMMQVSSADNSVGSQHVQYSHAEQLSGASSLRASRSGRGGELSTGYSDTDDSAVRGLRSRRMLNPRTLSFKADSETERIARIMQGSISYWRKGDATLNDSDDESFDSDDGGDCFF